jgi:hypothetical protein
MEKSRRTCWWLLSLFRWHVSTVLCLQELLRGGGIQDCLQAPGDQGRAVLGLAWSFAQGVRVML